jgi:hypothetical protein
LPSARFQMARVCGRDWLRVGNVPNGFKQAPAVVPVDPFQGGRLDAVQAPPGPFAADQLGLK